MTPNPKIPGIRADFIYTNYIIACLLLLFVIFLCIRMVSSTRRADVLTFLLIGGFLAFHWKEAYSVFISLLDSIASSPVAIFGVLLGCLGACGLCKGLYEEEQLLILKNILNDVAGMG